MRESQTSDNDKLVVKAVLVEDNLDMFKKLKKKYNLKYNIEVFHIILRKVYDLEFGE